MPVSEGAYNIVFRQSRKSVYITVIFQGLGLALTFTGQYSVRGTDACISVRYGGQFFDRNLMLRYYDHMVLSVLLFRIVMVSFA